MSTSKSPLVKCIRSKIKIYIKLDKEHAEVLEQNLHNLKLRSLHLDTLSKIPSKSIG